MSGLGAAGRRGASTRKDAAQKPAADGLGRPLAAPGRGQVACPEATRATPSRWVAAELKERFGVALRVETGEDNACALAPDDVL